MADDDDDDDDDDDVHFCGFGLRTNEDGFKCAVVSNGRFPPIDDATLVGYVASKSMIGKKGKGLVSYALIVKTFSVRPVS
jgi:hypothetical protein